MPLATVLFVSQFAGNLNQWRFLEHCETQFGMPPKAAAAAAEAPAAARFGRVKNNLRMGLVGVRAPLK